MAEAPGNSFADGPAVRLIAVRGSGKIHPDIVRKSLAGLLASTSLVTASQVNEHATHQSWPETNRAVQAIRALGPYIETVTKKSFIIIDGNQLLAGARQKQFSKALALAYRGHHPPPPADAMMLYLHTVQSLEMRHKDADSLAAALHLSDNILVTDPVDSLPLLQQYFPQIKNGIYHGFKDYDLKKVFNRTLLTDDDLSAFVDYHELGHVDQSRFLPSRRFYTFGPYAGASTQLYTNQLECDADAFGVLKFAQNEPGAQTVSKFREYAKVRFLGTMLAGDDTHDTARVLLKTTDLLEKITAKDWSAAEAEISHSLTTTNPNSQERSRLVASIMKGLKKDGLRGLSNDQLHQLSAGLTLAYAPNITEYEAKFAFLKGGGMAGADAASRKLNGHPLTEAQKLYLQSEIDTAHRYLAPGLIPAKPVPAFRLSISGIR